LLASIALAGCHRTELRDGAADVKVQLSFSPDPPRVGEVETTIRLTDPDGKPVRGAIVKLEGNMNHAGMKPSFAEAKESEPGSYQANLGLTMGGDWFILVDAKLADGRNLKRKVDLPGVRSR
jgi:hypothetical protein